MIGITKIVASSTLISSSFCGSILSALQRFQVVTLIVISGVFVSSSSAQTPGTKKWSYDTGYEIFSSPAVGPDGTLYIGVNDPDDLNPVNSKIVAVNSDGTLKWEKLVDDWVDASPLLVDGRIYIGSWDGYFYCLDAETGAEIWAYETFGYIHSSATMGSDGTLYVGTGESVFMALDSQTGDLEWYINLGDWIDSSPAFDDDGYLYVGSWDGFVYQIDPSLGGPSKILSSDDAVVWEYKTGDAVLASPAIASDGTVYVASADGKVYALTPGSSAAKWIFDTGSITDGIEGSPVIGVDGTIYIGTGSGVLYALNPDTGAMIWSYSGADDLIYSTPAITADGTILFGSGDYKVYALSSSGQKLWEFEAGDWVDSSPAIGPDGTIYFGSTDGKLYALHGNSPLGYSRWPKFRANNMNTGMVEGYRLWVDKFGVSDPDPKGDPDEDGLNTELEWKFNSDPSIAEFSSEGLDAEFLYEFSLLENEDWLIDFKSLQFQFSTDMTNWQTVDFSNPQLYSWLGELGVDSALGEFRLIYFNMDDEDRFFRLVGQ